MFISSSTSTYSFIIRTKLKSPDIPGDTPITCCTIDARGKIFAYAVGYDWHKVRILMFMFEIKTYEFDLNRAMNSIIHKRSHQFICTIAVI